MNDADAKKPMAEEELIDIDSPEAMEQPEDDERILAVSYTHLTLPTIYPV